MKKPVKDLVEGDRVDLEHDEYARMCSHGDNCTDPGQHESDLIFDQCEYAIVSGIEQETPDCIRVDFDNRESVGFPTDHEVEHDPDIDHRITVDEDTDHDGGTMFKAFCTDECGWSGDRWHHADEYTDREDKHPVDLATEAAEADGQDHLRNKGVIT